MVHHFLYYLVMLYYGIVSLPRVGERNTLKQQALLATEQKNYVEAIGKYEQIIKVSYWVEPAVRFNLGMLYQNQLQLEQAQEHFYILTNHSDKNLASSAYVQLGQLATIRNDTLTALNNYRKSLLLNERNDVARFNYELLRKRFKIPEQNINHQPHKKQQEAEQSEKREADLKRKKHESISEDKALQILEAMKNKEIQYIQQKRRRANTK